MGPFFEGILVGLTLAVLFGPALFALIQTSIHQGFRSGVLLALGIFLSDLTLIFLCFMGAVQILSDERNRLFFGIISSIILISNGIYTLTRKVYKTENGQLVIIQNNNRLIYLIKGFFLNFTNPFIWIFWVGLTVGITSAYTSDTTAAKIFFAGTLTATLTTDIIKVLIAKAIKQYLTPTKIRRINHFVGAMLILFGLIIIIRTFVG